MANKSEKFDCLENKWRIEKKIYNEIKDMTIKEKCQYFHKSIEESSLKDWWKAASGKNIKV